MVCSLLSLSIEMSTSGSISVSWRAAMSSSVSRIFCTASMPASSSAHSFRHSEAVPTATVVLVLIRDGGTDGGGEGEQDNNNSNEISNIRDTQHKKEITVVSSTHRNQCLYSKADPAQLHSRSLARRPWAYVAHWNVLIPRQCHSNAVSAACHGPKTTAKSAHVKMKCPTQIIQ